MIGRRVKARLAEALDRRFSHLESRIDALQISIDAHHQARSDAERTTLESIAALGETVDGELHGMIRAIASEEARNRRELYALRERADYRLAFTTATPLVSICIPTSAGRSELLMRRALPSALAQSYENIEVVVVGDAVSDETAKTIESVRDDRVRFFNLTGRVAHPGPYGDWLNAALMPRNESHRRARGLWIADLDDDDALKPDAVEALLEAARSRDLEVAYGLIRRHAPDEEGTTIGAFPPAPLEPDWRAKGMPWQPWQGSASTSAIVHGGLRMFAREHVGAVLTIPGDFFRLERMVRAGVRFGMLDQVVYDYYPAKLWGDEKRES